MATNQNKRYLRKFGVAGRAVQPTWQSNMDPRPTVLRRDEAFTDISLEELFFISERCNAVAKAIQVRIDYKYLNGIEWEPKWSRKCKRCGHKAAAKKSPEFCPKCNAGKGFDMLSGQDVGMGASPQMSGGPPLMRALPPPMDGLSGQHQMPGAPMMDGDPAVGESKWYDEPDEGEIERAESFFKHCDRNGHSLIDLGKIWTRFLQIADTAFIVGAIDYKVDAQGAVHDWDTKEITVADPRNFKLVSNPRTRVPGGKWRICLCHRPQTKDKNVTVSGFSLGSSSEGGVLGGDQEKCPVPGCGRRTYDVWYVNHEQGSEDTPIEYYVGPFKLADGSWFPGEVVHATEYSPSYGYGRAPTFQVRDLALLLMYMQRHMRTYYTENRLPRSLIAWPTRNIDSLRPIIKSMEDRNMSQEQQHTAHVGFDPAEGAHEPVPVTLSKLPEEMQYLEVMREVINEIGMGFGVEPPFLAHMEAGGLQNQGPLLWKISADSAKVGQGVDDNRVFPVVLQWLKVKDHNLKLAAVEDKDELKEWQTKTAEAGYAQIMTQLGFQVLGLDSEGHIKLSEKPNPGMGMGGMGGPPGMGGAMGGGMPPQEPAGGIADLPPVDDGDGSGDMDSPWKGDADGGM